MSWRAASRIPVRRAVYRTGAAASLLGALLSLAACEGTVREPFAAPVDSEPGKRPVASASHPDGGPAASGAPDSQACGPRSPARVVLLNDFQHVSAVRSLLGGSALTGDDLPNRQLKPFAQKGLVVNTSLVHTRWEWGADASTKLAANTLGCAKLDDACAKKFLGAFSERAFRRPVDDEELTDLMAVYTLAAKESPLHGVQRAIEAVLAAPSFLYRRELGVADKNGALQLDAYELASMLSFALTDAPPDDTLWASALDGTLVKQGELAKHVKRMLALPAVHESLTGTLLAAWGMGNIFGAAKDPELFPAFSSQLQASMYREAELLVNDVFWTRQAPLNELLSTTTTFVDGPLAALYGVPKPSKDFAPVSLPADQRAGLLTQAGVMAMLARSDTTSVVARGLFVRGLLCMTKVPSPPESLADAVAMLLKEDLSERERAEVRAKNSTCAGCHTGIDPFGLLLERYDPLGRYRTTLDGTPIDTKVDVPGSNSYSGEQADALAFARSITDGDDFSSCVAARVMSYALQDDGLSPRDCQLAEAIDGVDPSVAMPELVERVFASPALRARIQETP
jgi:Protein of unknown function (DUF1592)/Protein of unknown function (DUF1588)/Protein of unknown function (DUF1595)